MNYSAMSPEEARRHNHQNKVEDFFRIMQQRKEEDSERLMQAAIDDPTARFDESTRKIVYPQSVEYQQETQRKLRHIRKQETIKNLHNMFAKFTLAGLKFVVYIFTAIGSLIAAFLAVYININTFITILQAIFT